MGRVLNALVGLGVATGFYFGYQVVMLAPSHEFLIFRGSFIVTSGDSFQPSLAHKESLEFEQTSEKYKELIDSLFQEGPLNGVNVKSEILKFEKPVNASLRVIFQLHVSSRTNIRVDTGDLFFTFSDMMISKNWTMDGGIVINKDSLELQALERDFLIPLSSGDNDTLETLGSYITDARYDSTEENNDNVEEEGMLLEIE